MAFRWKKWLLWVPLSILTFIVFVFVGLVVYLVLNPPCSTPLTYALGVIDKRFGITNDKILKELREAESVWEKTSPYNLFEYEADKKEADISIDFIYDDRQETLVNGRALDAETEQYNKTIAAYEARLDRFEARVDTYNRDDDQYGVDLERWNNGNRKNEAEYNRLHTEGQRLKAENAYLKQESALLEQVQEKLEPIRTALGDKVKEFNETGEDVVEDGRWIPRDDKIIIYRYEGDRELKWLLAHELGHALGMEHVEYPRSVMHYLSSDVPILTLSNDDVRELARVCWE